MALCGMASAIGYPTVPCDSTSFVYQNKNLDELSHADSLYMFLPLSTRNLNDFNVKSFCIRAKYI